MSIKNKIAAGLIAFVLAAPAFADIHHVVIFKYQAGVSMQKRAEIARAFIGLKESAKRDGKSYIVSIIGGKAISKEGFDKGFEEAFVVTFKNTDDRNYFVGKPYSQTMDPNHLALAKIAEPLLARDATGNVVGLFVFDFDTAGPR